MSESSSLRQVRELEGACTLTGFSPEPYQYFEAVAMRLPCVEAYQPVFTLIEYLNKQFSEDPIELIDFKYSSPEEKPEFMSMGDKAEEWLCNVS